MADQAYAGYPAPFIYGENKSSKLQQLIWGDFVRLTGPAKDGWVPVHSRRTDGWMKEKDLQQEQLLEVCFVDIGQGDGALVILPKGGGPKDEFLLVDAGETDNMHRFLSWRFNLRKHPDRVIDFRAAVISHPDQDHYKGFSSLFKSEQFSFQTLFHNGIVERGGKDGLGPTDTIKGTKYLTEFVREHEQLEALVTDKEVAGSKVYPNMLAAGIKNGSIQSTQGLAAPTDMHVPGFEADKPVTIEVLGPRTNEVDGAEMLRYFTDPGKTKNGHSVVLKLTYGDVRILLGGDLNIPAELHLLREHLGEDVPEGAQELEEYLDKARQIFQADVAKACHQGSADFTTAYLRAVNPVATVISSGDDESHAHPRPDALGAFGKFSRGERPLIFSTELARSAKENIKSADELRLELKRLIERRDSIDADSPKRAAADAAIDKLLATLERSVAVYGMINLRTDGKNILMAQKLEAKRPNGQEWDVHQLERDDSGEFTYVSKH